MKKLILGLVLAAAFVFSGFSEENTWAKELAFNLNFPITHNEVSYDTTDSNGNSVSMKDSLDTTGAGFLFGARFYRKDNGLSLLAQGGISYATAKVEDDDEFDMDDLTGALCNFSFGIGKRIGFSDDRGSFIPSFIIGFHYADVENSMKYSGYSFDYSVELLAFEIGGNVYFSYLLGEKVGLTASLDLTFNFAGSAKQKLKYSGLSYSETLDLNGGTVNILPAVGLFVRL